MFADEKPLDKLVDFDPDDLIGRLIVQYFFPADFLYRDYQRVNRALAKQRRRTRWRSSQEACYLRLWLAALYTVAEGFRALRLEDDKINDLLRSKHFTSLRHFRNGTFHYQEKPFKHVQFFLDGTVITHERLEWAQELHQAFDRFQWAYRKINMDRKLDAIVSEWRSRGQT